MSDPQDAVAQSSPAAYAAPPPGYILVPLLAPRPPAPPGNGLATAAMTLGIIGLTLSAVPFAGLVLAPLPALLAAVFGHVGHHLARARGGLKRHHAIAGLVTGYAALVLAPVLWFAGYVIVGR